MNLAQPQPAADDLLAARQAAEHTQEQAAQAAGVAVNTWARAERGETNLGAAHWSLYLLATDQHPAARVVRRRQQPGTKTGDFENEKLPNRAL